MLFSSAAQAMEIRHFDKMAIPDRHEYVGLLAPQYYGTFVERNTAARKFGRRFELQGNCTQQRDRQMPFY